MHRPKPLSNGAVGINLSPLHKLVAQNLNDHGEHYFKSTELLDAFGLASTPAQTQQAISRLLTFTKWLGGMGCRMSHVGFREIERSELRFSFTYQVESAKHENAPLLVNLHFQLEVPLLMLATETATMWSQAFDIRPIADIKAIAQGK